MVKPIRVCVVITGLGIGGAEHALLKLLTAMDRQRVEVSLVVLGQLDALAPQFRAIGIEPIFIGLRAGRWPLGEVGRLIRAVRELEPDLLQGWMYHGNLAASFVAARLARPACWSVRDTPDAAHGHSRFTRMTIALSRWYLGRVTRIFNVSARSAAYCSEHLGWPAERTEVLPNGLDLSRFRPDPAAREAFRQEQGWSTDTPVVAMVARWSPVKNHRLFLEAAASLRARLPEVRFVLIGKDLDAGNTTLAGWLAELDLLDAVVLLGPRHDVEALYPAFDLVALTSKSEGFPNVLAEAMACGVPVVTTDVGDAAEIVGDTGCVVSPTAQAFADALARLLVYPERAARGRAARERIAARYAIDGIAARLTDRYAAIVNAGR